LTIPQSQGKASSVPGQVPVAFDRLIDAAMHAALVGKSNITNQQVSLFDSQ
jgi:hypothetical protein